MSAQLPNDPMILLSVINTKLRDHYSNLEALCQDLMLDEEELKHKFATIDYEYDAHTNQFV